MVPKQGPSRSRCPRLSPLLTRSWKRLDGDWICPESLDLKSRRGAECSSSPANRPKSRHDPSEKRNPASSLHVSRWTTAECTSGRKLLKRAPGCKFMSLKPSKAIYTFRIGAVFDLLLACLIPGYDPMPTWLCYLVVGMPFISGLLAAVIGHAMGEAASDMRVAREIYRLRVAKSRHYTY